MIDHEELIEGLIEAYRQRIQMDLNIRIPRKRIGSDNPSYKDAEDYGYRAGQLLSAVLKDNLTEELFEGHSLSEEDVVKLLIPMLKENYEKVAAASMQVQATLNKNAGLGLDVVKPPFDQDKADGFITAFTERETYKEAEFLLGDPIVTNSQGVVEDCLKANADMHYKAGLQPTITRIAEPGCCEWCSGLADEYKYPGVSQEVFRRHNNCRCEVLYDPKNGKIQNSHTKEWYDEKDVSERFAQYEKKLEKDDLPNGATDVTKTYISDSTPGKGNISFIDSYDKSKYNVELEYAKAIHKKLGGNIELLEPYNTQNKKRADYLWNYDLWEQKTCGSAKAADSAVRTALKQIEEAPGGIMIDFADSVNLSDAISVICDRLRRSMNKFDVIDVLISKNRRLEKVIRFKK